MLHFGASHFYTIALFFYSINVWFLFLQPFVQPAEEGTLPENSVLWFQYPMILVWEDEQLGRNATHASRIEGSHALVCIDAIVFLAMDAEDRSVPLVYKLVRAVLVCLLGVDSSVFVPVSIIVLPVGEPNLLSVSTHAFEVER